MGISISSHIPGFNKGFVLFMSDMKSCEDKKYFTKDWPMGQRCVSHKYFKA